MRYGIDLGGTKIEIIALNDVGDECFRKRVPTPQGSYSGTIAAIVSLVADADHVTGTEGSVGVGIPGAISPLTGKVKNANSVCLIGRSLREDLETALNRPVRLANDANCFALSEATDGTGAGAAVVFGVIVGTGTGGGIIANGKLIEGVNLIAGEWGHNPLPWMRPSEYPGPQCYCGKKGCIETFLSGPGLAADYASASRRKATGEEIARRADAGDTDATAALERYEDRMARALASVINILDPDVIVLGGGVSNIKRLYTNVPQRWMNYVFSDGCVTQLVPAKYGDASGVRGAAWLW